MKILSDETETLSLDRKERGKVLKSIKLFFIYPEREIVTKRVKRGEEIVIGREYDCDVIVYTKYCSKRHLSILNIDNRNCIIKDLGSKNGTFVNNIKVKEAICKIGDIIKIGDLEIVIGEELAKIEELPYLFDGFIGGISNSTKELRKELEKVASLDCNLLIEGETGTGKELCARFIHRESFRSNAPFITVNCGSLSKELAYTELFGHLKGAFTGAITTRKGAFQEADKGTLFLDEIGELPLELQPLLLRAIEYGMVKRLGSNREEKVNVRIISATNRDLLKEVKEGRFRLDLYHRLSEYKIKVPSLNERREDIPYIVKYYFKIISERMNRRKFITEDGIELLAKEDWEGNVRELRNFIYKIFVSFKDDIITSRHIIQLLKERESIERTKEIERYLERLIKNEGNISKTAYELGIPRSTLRQRIEKFKAYL